MGFVVTEARGRLSLLVARRIGDGGGRHRSSLVGGRRRRWEFGRRQNRGAKRKKPKVRGGHTAHPLRSRPLGSDRTAPIDFVHMFIKDGLCT